MKFLMPCFPFPCSRSLPFFPCLFLYVSLSFLFSLCSSLQAALLFLLLLVIESIFSFKPLRDHSARSLGVFPFRSFSYAIADRARIFALLGVCVCVCWFFFFSPPPLPPFPFHSIPDYAKGQQEMKPPGGGSSTHGRKRRSSRSSSSSFHRSSWGRRGAT